MKTLITATVVKDEAKRGKWREVGFGAEQAPDRPFVSG